MAPNIKIAICQFEPKECDVKHNFNTALNELHAAGAIDIFILPEYHLTSWCPKHPHFVAATKEAATFLPAYQQLAREHNTSIVPGTICEVIEPTTASSGDGDGGPREIEIRNMAYFIEAGTGTVLASYQKKNLWHEERPHLTAGTEPPHSAFDTHLRWPSSNRPVRAGLLVCWDLAFPEAFRELVADGADLILIPSFWHMNDVDSRALALSERGEAVFLESVVVARACENTAAVVFCNAGGLSCVAMPILGRLGGMGVGEEGTSVVDVDLGVLEVAEGNYRIREDMLAEGWHYTRFLEGREREEGDRRTSG